jgi:hypothetical protein
MAASAEAASPNAATASMTPVSMSAKTRLA